MSNYIQHQAKYRLLPEQRVDIRAKTIAVIDELSPFEIQCYNQTLKRQWAIVNNEVIQVSEESDRIKAEHEDI